MENWKPSRPISLALSGSRPTLDEVLANQAPPPYTLTAFMAYLSQNHCLETLEFTMDSKRYLDNYMSVARQTNEIPIMSETPQAANLCMLWQRLLSAYIVPGAPREINLPSTVRDALLRHSNSRRPPHPETLDSAVKRMRDLMDESIFIPFLNSRASQAPPQPRRRNDEISLEETGVNPGVHRRMSIRHQRLSPQSSFVSPRSTTSGYFSYNTSTTSQGTHHAPSRSNTTRASPHGYTSCDSGTGNLTDDTGSIPSSPGVNEPMTPPTTPPSSDLHSPKNRSENTWKKMGMKLGWKKRPPGGSGGGSSGGGATSGPASKTSDYR